MSHHEQNKGPHEHRQGLSFNVQNQADQLLLQQSLTTNPNIHMGNLNQQGNDNWHRYYSQIGGHSRQQLPFMENSQFPLTLNSYSSAIQRSNNMVMSGQNIQSGGVMGSQPHQQLYNHQQQPVSIASTASVSDLASLAQQQYLIMTQQQHYLQQQQQYVSQSIQDPLLEQHLITNSIQSLNYPSTSAANLSAISQSSQKITTNTDYINQPIFQESIKKSFEITEQSQNIRSKSPENANIMAQKALEAHAEAKAQEALKKSQVIQDELKRKQINANEHAQIVKEHIQSFNDPINLAGCHTLSKVSMYLPFPTEMASTSNTLLPCFDQQQAVLVLSNDDLSLTNYLGALLADTTNHINKINLKHEESELCNLEGIPELPALIYAVDAQHGTAFVINDETNLQEACNSTTNIKNSEFDDKTNVEFTYASNQLINYSSNIDSSGAHLKKKKDMAESLQDSLSGYFSTSHQNRNRTVKCNNDDEDHVSITSAERENEEQFGLIKDEKMQAKKSRKRMREPSVDADEVADNTQTKPNRPPTPTDVIQQREFEWKERQKQREEKYRRRQMQNDSKLETWNVDALSENEAFCRFNSLMDQILEQTDEARNLMPSTINEESGLLLECALLEELRIEAQKLKSWKKICNIPVDKLIKLLAIMEKNIRDILTEDGELAIHAKMKNAKEDESDETLRELIDDRLLRSVDAAMVAMYIMTSKRIPKQLLMEDVIEHSIKLCKSYMHEVICAVDSAGPQAKSRKTMDANLISKRQKNYNTTLYVRLVDLMSCFSELARFHNLNESLMFQLSSLGTPPFFIENVPEMQMQAIKLLPIIFAKCPPIRKTLLYELLNSLHKLPQTRNIRNTYRLSSNESIGNFTVLILQLIQSTVQLPAKKSSQHHFRDRDSKTILVDDLDDRLVMDSFEEAKKIAAFFLGGFLAKCTAKAEDDYRRLFEQFLQDILVALYRPMWPVVEMIITVLGNLLVVHYRTKTYDLSLRVASLDYLGIITARLRKDRVHMLSEDATSQEKARLNSIVKSLLFDEYSYDPSYNIDEIDISHISSSEKVRKLEQALFDYIMGTMWDGDLSVEFVLLFYAVEWYRETVLDVEVVKEKYSKAIAKGEFLHKEKQKYEQKMLRIADKGQGMKLFIIGLMDKQNLKRRIQLIAKSGNIMVENDANWVVKYLASKKELSQSFEIYLRKILEGFNPEIYPVAIRAKAMKCLAQIIEADYQVLMIPEVNKIVQDRLIDANASVREATFDLIGKCLVSKPELLETYYSILINRTKDTAVAVRKRVIRILREIVFLDILNKNLVRNSQILSGIIQRINDEDGVKKLCLETFQQIWMQPINEKAKLETKICLLVETAKCCIADGALEHFDTLISILVQNTQEQNTLIAAKQIVDAMVEYILLIEKKAVEEQKNNANDEQVVDSAVNYQARLFATLSSLSIFAKARPELLIRHIEVFIPYLSALSSSSLESNVVNQIITMLEQIIPLMGSYDTSFSLIRQIENKLNDITKDGGMLLIASAISCMSAIHEKFSQGEQPGICKLFCVYYKYIEKCKREIENDRKELNPEKKPNLLRALYSMGLMCRYFDFDILLNKNQLTIFQMDGALQESAIDANETIESEKQNIGIVKLSAFSLLFYFSRSPDYPISQKALIALGQLTAGHPIFLRRDELKNMYMVLLNSDNCIYLQLKVQVLKNIACFLFTEEQKALKRAKHTKQEQEKQQHKQEDNSSLFDSSDEQSQSALLDVDDLKEMELGSSGLSSSIIQQYWGAILNCYFHNDENVRINSAQVIRQTLEQGLVTPGSSISTLIAMSTDSSNAIRSRAEILIRDMNTKYKGLIMSKAIPGVRMAFQLQKKIRVEPGQIIRGIRANENLINANKTADKKLPSFSTDIHSLLGIFYINIRKNRQSRRNFLNSLLKFFSEENKEKLEREECLFIADNLAHFPYTVMDEPLYVIYYANSIISISGQNILSQFRQLLIKPIESTTSQHNTPMKEQINESSKEYSMLLNTDEQEEFGVQYIIDHLPNDRSAIYELKRNSRACFILLHLKTFLMRMYGLKEEKISEYSPSEAANVYEKPINRRNIPTFSNDLFDELAFEQGNEGYEKRKIAEDFHKFHEMLLSLDEERRDEDESMVIDTQNNQIEEGESIQIQ